MQEQHVTEQHVTRAIPYEVPYEGDFKKAQITRSFSEETVCAQALVSKRGFPVKPEASGNGSSLNSKQEGNPILQSPLLVGAISFPTEAR